MATLETSKSCPEINSSLMSLFDTSVFYTALWPVEAFVDTIQEAGYKGLEWHPVRGIVAGVQMNTGLITQNVRDAVVSLHQSWRIEKNVKQAWNHPNRMLAMASYVILPERVSSLNDLEHLQRVLGKELPVVLYPPDEGEESGTERHFDEKTFEPLPHVLRDWDVHSVDELTKEAYRRGYTGLCLDLYHMRRSPVGGRSLNPWQETLPQLLPHTQEIHVSAGRVDQQQSHIDTLQELNDLLAGRGNTELLEMLRAIRQSRWTGRIVTEIPAIALHVLRKRANPFSTVKDLIEEHKIIVRNVQDLLA